MNDLEQRIADGFSSVEQSVNQVSSEFLSAAWLPSNGYDPLSSSALLQLYSVNPNIRLAQGVPPGLSEYATCICFGKCEYKILLYIDVFGALAIWSTNQNRWKVPTSKIVLGTLNFTAPRQSQTISCTHISDYQSLTADNFYYKLPDGAITYADAEAGGSIRSELQTPSLSYDSSSGILTVNSGYARAAAHQFGACETYPSSITVICVV